MQPSKYDLFSQKITIKKVHHFIRSHESIPLKEHILLQGDLFFPKKRIEYFL